MRILVIYVLYEMLSAFVMLRMSFKPVLEVCKQVIVCNPLCYHLKLRECVITKLLHSVFDKVIIKWQPVDCDLLWSIGRYL